MGMAEGFASGFGLVDAALQRRRSNEIAANRADQEQQNRIAEFAYKDRALGLQEASAAADAEYKRGMLQRYQNEETLKNEQFNKTLSLKERELSADTAAKNAALGIQQQNALTNSIQAEAENREREIKVKAAEHELALAEKEGAQRDLQMYITDDKQHIRVLPGQEERFIDLVKKGLNTDVYDMGKRLPEYQRNFAVMQNTLLHPETVPMDERGVITEPNLVGAFNLFGKDEISKGIGEVDKDGNKVISKSAAGLIYHPENDTFSIALNVTKQTQDGKGQFSYIAPMTEGRSSDSKSDTNVRQFTKYQLSQWVIGKGAVLDLLSKNPDFVGQIVDGVERTTKTGKDKGDHVIKTGVTVYDSRGDAFGTRDVLYNADKNTFIDPEEEMKKGKGGLDGSKQEIRYDSDGNAYIKDKNGNVVPYKP